jgi:hypothetical protein
MLLDSWQEILAALAHNRLRALLTAFGVFWGVFVWPQRTSRAYQGLQPGRYVRFRTDDIQAVAEPRGVEDLSPRLQGGDWRHRIHPHDDQAIGSFNVAERFGRLQSLFKGIAGFVWFVGTLTLLAGMLGVSNILLITVKERTRELGTRKALGAPPWAIVSMVLQEAVALASIAGYSGSSRGWARSGRSIARSLRFRTLRSRDPRSISAQRSLPRCY